MARRCIAGASPASASRSTTFWEPGLAGSDEAAMVWSGWPAIAGSDARRPWCFYRYRCGRSSQGQTNFYAHGHGRSNLDVLSVGSKAFRRYGHVIGVEWHVREAETAGTVRGSRSLVTADRVVDGNRRIGHHGTGRV